MTQHNSAKGKKRRKKPEKLEFVQDFIPIKDLRHGIIETTDGRYIKILEIEPINFMLRSDDEQFSIISTFASWLKISSLAVLIPISTWLWFVRNWKQNRAKSVSTLEKITSISSRTSEAEKRSQGASF